MNDTFFKKAKENILNISMTPGEKKVLLQRIMSTSPSTSKAPVRSTWTIFSFSSLVSSHRFASAFAIILIIGLGGNTLVSASQSALPGDALYPLKVNIAEPMRVAFAPNFVARANIQSDLVQTRFEEAEMLAVQGNLDESKENEISARVTKHVSNLNTDIGQIKGVSEEKANEVSDTAQASVRAHARLLSDISVGRGEKKSKLSDATREAAMALGDEEGSDAARVGNQAAGSMIMMSEIADPATTVGIPAPTTTIEMPNARKGKAIPESATMMSMQADLLIVATTTDREFRKQIKEEEIFQKAKEKLERRGRKVEIRSKVE